MLQLNNVERIYYAGSAIINLGCRYVVCRFQALGLSI